MMELSIIELESCLNLNQILIDNVVRGSKINGIQNAQLQKKLNELNKQRQIIINQIEKKLHEICYQISIRRDASIMRFKVIKYSFLCFLK